MNKRELRRRLKLCAKQSLFQYMLPCIIVSVLGSVIATLFSTILTGQMPDWEGMMQSADVLQYWPQMAKVYGLTLVFTILISPLTVGGYAFFSRVVNGEKPPVQSLFTWLGEGSKLAASYKATLYYLLIGLKYIVIFGVPVGVLGCLAELAAEKLPVAAAVALAIVIGLLMMAAAVVSYVRLHAYLPAMYMIAQNPALGTADTFRRCGEMMRGRVWEFFVYRLSFIGWEILAAFTCGLSVLFVTPYISLSIAAFTQEAEHRAGYAQTCSEEASV